MVSEPPIRRPIASAVNSSLPKGLPLLSPPASNLLNRSTRSVGAARRFATAMIAIPANAFASAWPFLYHGSLRTKGRHHAGSTPIEIECSSVQKFYSRYLDDLGDFTSTIPFHDISQVFAGYHWLPAYRMVLRTQGHPRCQMLDSLPLATKLLIRVIVQMKKLFCIQGKQSSQRRPSSPFHPSPS